MQIAIGSKSKLKTGAIREAAENCLYFSGQETKIISAEVKSEISEMPLTLDENISGAKNRANNTKKMLHSQNKATDFYIGIEGGTTLIGGRGFVFEVIYILSKSGENHFAITTMTELPLKIQKRIYNNKEDLGVIMNEFTGVEKTEIGGCAFGNFSDQMFTRKSQLVTAFHSAISPFFNKYYK